MNAVDIDWTTLGTGLAILLGLWRVYVTLDTKLDTKMGTLHRDIADLRERMARLEGLFEGFARRSHENAGNPR